uniref:Prenylcysteine oxidase 1 n=1 Tax=Oncorhynchus tshawytscha TaxID=74940 RepID=A0A8C8IFF2_ONCTS
DDFENPVIRALLFLGLWSQAVVGAGIGGTATAYFVRLEFGAVVKFDVFEPGTVYETGVLYMYGMSHGKELTFEESDWFIVNFLHLLQQYRFNFLLMQMLLDSVPDKFMRIYQQFSYSFTSVEKLLHAMGGDGFLTLANQMLEEAMLVEDISQSFLNDVVAPVNYGQSVLTSVFSGCVFNKSLKFDKWFRVLLCGHPMKTTITASLPANVMGLRPNDHPSSLSNEVNYVWESGFTHSLNDIVIVATSLHKGKPAGFTSPPLQASPLLSPPSTLGTSTRLASLTCPTWGPEIPLPSVCQDILTPDSIINSLSSIDPVDIQPGYSCPPVNESKVWKVFSPQPLSQEQLQDMFLSSETKYPAHSPPHGRTSPFILHERLYYLNTVEWAASIMEISTISARNLALLAHQHGQVRPGGPTHV